MKKNIWTGGAHTALTNGNIRLANHLAQTIYTIRGLVVHGNHLGRTLGFPTANLRLECGVPFLPPHGVYAVNIDTGNGYYQGMANAGIRPTVDGKNMTVEVHIFDFSGDLYEKFLTILFIDRIRPEIKFDSLDQLVNQIKEDKITAIRLLS
jgi:riboflavin kinase/FMN adenylyltransferase